jgi:hypothetical protein
MGDQLKEKGWTIFQTSAKSGDGVEAAFHSLSTRIIASDSQ